ncbi:MAG TPA: potassium-transporting ATPase subunit KdpC [Thermoanaerobaculia bacterium]|nr:potassium-transporting ATPase subunit KdpC [Thermoanaerobaculia bacterium]
MKENVFGSIRLFLALTVLLGVAYPLVVWGIGRVAFREKADGSLLKKEQGKADSPVVGSSLIGQAFVMPGHFHGRPSAAGNGYDPTSSSGTNFGPTSKKLADSIKDAVTAVRTDEAVTGAVPADAVTSSASGLDPDISPEYARLQIPRVSRETRIPAADLETLVARNTDGRFLGVYGESRVNVLALNVAIDSKLGHPQIAPTPTPTPAPAAAPAAS